MIKAIETSYAGCRFRSRLEARWAVFFDRLGIRWEYEKQGFECSPRVTRFPSDDEKFAYLPDFWFPDHSLYGEVKGSLTVTELNRLLDAAACLSSNDGAGCHDWGGHDLIVFGNIPSHDTYRLPTILHMHKGDLNASGWTGEPNGCNCGEILITDAPEFYLPPDRIIQWLIRGSWADQWSAPGDWAPVAAAYRAARSTRFEHGQTGA